MAQNRADGIILATFFFISTQFYITNLLLAWHEMKEKKNIDFKNIFFSFI